MSLKSRYAGLLLLVLILLIIFCAAMVQAILMGQFIGGAILAVLLYGATYFLGRKFARIFFVLSLLKLLRKNGGRLSMEAYNSFIDASLGTRRSGERKAAMKKEILATLTREGLVVVRDDTLLLVN